MGEVNNAFEGGGKNISSIFEGQVKISFGERFANILKNGFGV